MTDGRSRDGGYGRGTAVLSAGIGVTGLVTYAFFSLSSYALDDAQYGRITLLWSAVFVVVSVLYRPVEQLLSRSLADRAARGGTRGAPMRVAATIQLGLGAAFLVGALLGRRALEDGLFGGSSALYWILVATVLAYAASYFARGFLAGGRHFGLYGGLVLMESLCRVCFPLAAVVGLASGQAWVALGILAAPIASLAVVPWALGRRLRRTEEAPAPAATDGSTADPAGEFTLSHGAGFALAVLVIMAAEQTFLNAGPLVVKATGGAEGAALAGLVFNVLLIARAPLQLFQSVQTAILPHLTRLRAGGEADPFRRSVQVTLIAVAGFAGVVALALAAVGPWVLGLVFEGEGEYARGGLVLVALGMGLYLASATLNQAALARGQATRAAGCWAASALAFLGLLLAPWPEDPVLRVEGAFLLGSMLLAGLLLGLYRRTA